MLTIGKRLKNYENHQQQSLQKITGLYEITVPSLGYMSAALENIASQFSDVTILRISNHDEIQVRVAVYGKSELDQKEIVYKIRHGLGSLNPEYMFEYKLPTLGKSPEIESAGGLPIKTSSPSRVYTPN